MRILLSHFFGIKMNIEQKNQYPSIDYVFDEFNKNILEDIKLSIYNSPIAVLYISPKSLNELMEITHNRIKLLKSICIIKYYNELRIVGYDNYKAEYNLYTLPSDFEKIMNKLGITFDDTSYVTIQYAQYDFIDYYTSNTTQENIKYELDDNKCKIYVIF